MRVGSPSRVPPPSKSRTLPSRLAFGWEVRLLRPFPLSLPAVTLAHALTSLRLASLSRWTVPFKKKLLTDSGVYLRVQEVSLYQVMEVVLHLAGSSGSPPSWQWLHRVKFSFEGCMTTADYVEASAKRI